MRAFPGLADRLGDYGAAVDCSAFLLPDIEGSLSGGIVNVAKENPGKLPGLVAGAALLIDYILTAAVRLTADKEHKIPAVDVSQQCFLSILMV